MSKSATMEKQGQGMLSIEIPETAMALQVQYIPWEMIFPDPEQPRVEADTELKASIAAGGIRQPITVRPQPGSIGMFQIVDGERRWRGAQDVQSRIPCIVRLDMDDDAERVRTQLIANTGKPLTPVEEARAMAALMSARGGSVTELAAYLGKPVTTVSQRLNLMQLGPWLALIQKGLLKYTHAAEVLLPYRGCPDAVHAAVIDALGEKLTVDVSEDSAFESSEDFEFAVNPLYKKHLYPIAKKKDDPKPIFNTAMHDRECECGGLEIKEWNGKRRFCGNPEWWQPLEKAAKKEARAKEKASSGTSTPKAKTARLAFSVPAEVAVLKGQEWDMPKGYARLLDTEGQWAVISEHRPAEAFDPRGIVFPLDSLAVLGRLLLVKEQHAVVKQARKAWEQRWAERLGDLRTQFATQMEKGARGVATPTVALDTLAAFVWQADKGVLQTLFEIAEILELDVTALQKAAEKNYGWGQDSDAKRTKALVEAARKLKPKDAATLLSAIVTAVHKDLDLPSDALLSEQQTVATQILKSKHPFIAKGAKGAKGAKAGAAADDDTDAEADEELGDAFVDEDDE